MDILGECVSVDRQSVSRRRISTRGRRITKGRESWRLAVSERLRGRDHHGRGDRGRCEEELVGSHRRWEGVQALVRVGRPGSIHNQIMYKVGHSRGLPTQHPHPDRSVPILTSSSDGRPYMEPLKSRSCVGNFRNCGQSAHFSRHILLQTRAMKTTSLQNAGRTISPSLHVPKQCTNNYKQIKYDIFCSCFLLFYSNSFLVSDPRVAKRGIWADALRINNIILLFVLIKKYVYSTDFRRIFGLFSEDVFNSPDAK